MIRLAHLIKLFETDFLNQYGATLLPSQRRALSAFQTCRNVLSAQMKLQCEDCLETQYLPHSCGHRNCPHCQAHESQRWIERQQAKQLPCDYFLITFTLPSQWRTLVWQHQSVLYDMLIGNAWKTIETFSQNDRALQGTPGAMAVLHTHNRRLDFHPHVHVLIPAGAINKASRKWRIKRSNYLFSHKALAKVFRAKMIDSLTQSGLRSALSTSEKYPEKWVVDCKKVGNGAKAIVYLGRYLYRGVIAEKNILSCEQGMVRFRYRDSKTGKSAIRTVSGVEFLRLLLQHILPRGFRRARDFGFLHSNSKQLISLLQLKLKFLPTPFIQKTRPALLCSCCGGIKKIIQTRLDMRQEKQVKASLIRQGLHASPESMM